MAKSSADFCSWLVTPQTNLLIVNAASKYYSSLSCMFSREDQSSRKQLSPHLPIPGKRRAFGAQDLQGLKASTTLLCQCYPYLVWVGQSCYHLKWKRRQRSTKFCLLYREGNIFPCIYTKLECMMAQRKKELLINIQPKWECNSWTWAREKKRKERIPPFNWSETLRKRSSRLVVQEFITLVKSCEQIQE